jgi:hypothetical protein
VLLLPRLRRAELGDVDSQKTTSGSTASEPLAQFTTISPGPPRLRCTCMRPGGEAGGEWALHCCKDGHSEQHQTHADYGRRTLACSEHAAVLQCDLSYEGGDMALCWYSRRPLTVRSMESMESVYI